MRALLMLPIAVGLLVVAVDWLTARPSYWRVATYEFDVVDAVDRQPIRAFVTMTYEGPLAGQPGSGASYTTIGEPYETYRGMTPDIGYGGFAGIVRIDPKTRILRRHDRIAIEGVRFRIEADGYEPFSFAPVDSRERPLAFEADPPVFRVELPRKGTSGAAAAWSTRPELKNYQFFGE